jgi:hypothetical protein
VSAIAFEIFDTIFLGNLAHTIKNLRLDVLYALVFLHRLVGPGAANATWSIAAGTIILVILTILLEYIHLLALLQLLTQSH